MGKKGGGRVRIKQMGGAGKMPQNPLADMQIAPEDQIPLPPKPDSNSGFLIWPMSETFSMNYKNFSTIYPNYIDSNKTVKMGRRIASKDAIPEPTCQDIHEALKIMDIKHVIQPHKGYSRDASSRWENPGRILVDLEGAVESGAVLQMSNDGAFDLSEMPDMDVANENNNDNREGKGKKQLLRQLGQIIRDLPGRKVRIEAKNKLLEEEKLKLEKEIKAAAATTKTKASSGGGGNRKKKGKKKK